MEKLKKEKHNHKLTDLLKVLIFSMVMLAPIFSVVSKVMYVSFNKNAYQSYSASEEFTYYEKQKTLMPSAFDNNNKIQVNNYYSFTGSYTGQDFEFANSNLSFEFEMIQGSINLIRYTSISNEYSSGDISSEWQCYINLVYESSNLSIYQVLSGENDNYEFLIDNITSIQFDCIVKILTIDNYDTNLSLFNITNYYETTYVEKTIEQQTLDNTFEYAVNGLVDNNLYNWAEDTFAYTSINAMCTGLSVQNGVLPLLLSYWIIITAIYIVFDIIIFTFTKLTHLLQD